MAGALQMFLAPPHLPRGHHVHGGQSLLLLADHQMNREGGRGNSHCIVVERKELVEVVFVLCVALSAGGTTSWSVGGTGPPGQLLHYRGPH